MYNNKSKMIEANKCSICLTQKQTRAGFNEHYAWCSRIHMSNKEHSAEIDASEKTPTMKELFKFVRKLAVENDNLKKEIMKLKQNSNIQYRKQVEEWLSMDMNLPKYTYTDWLKTITPHREDVIVAMKSDLRDGIKLCLERAFHDKMPIRAFVQKPNTFYIFDTMAESSAEVIDSTYIDKPKWRIMTLPETKKMILILSQRFLNDYLNWEIENRDEIEEKEDLKNKQITYFTNINGGKISMDARVNDIKRWLYSKIQENVKNIDY